MKTRRLLWLLVCVGVISLTGCTGRDAYGLYTKALGKYDGLKQAEVSMKMLLTMKVEDQDISTVTDAMVKKIRDKEGKDQLSMDMSMDFLDQKRNMQMYYADGSLYVDYADQKTKSAITEDAAKEKLYLNFFDITKPYITESSVTKTEMGKTLHFGISPDITNKAMERQYAAIMESYGVEREDMKVNNIDLTVDLDKKGNLKKTVVAFVANIQFDGKTVPFQYDITSEVKATTGVTLAVPDDLQEYIESDEPSA